MLRLKPINIMCRYNGEFLSVRAGGTFCYDSDIKGYQIITLAIYRSLFYLSNKVRHFPLRGGEGLLSSYGLCD